MKTAKSGTRKIRILHMHVYFKAFVCIEIYQKLLVYVQNLQIH